MAPADLLCQWRGSGQQCNGEWGSLRARTPVNTEKIPKGMITMFTESPGAKNSFTHCSEKVVQFGSKFQSSWSPADNDDVKEPIYLFLWNIQLTRQFKVANNAVPYSVRILYFLPKETILALSRSQWFKTTIHFASLSGMTNVCFHNKKNFCKKVFKATLTLRKKACCNTPGTPNVLLSEPTPITKISYLSW